MVAEIVFEEGLGGFIPIENVSDADLAKAIQQLIDEVNKRKTRRRRMKSMTLKAMLEKHPMRSAYLQIGIGAILMALLYPLGPIGTIPSAIGLVLICTSPIWAIIEKKESKHDRV